MKQGLPLIPLQVKRFTKVIMGLPEIVQVSIDNPQIMVKVLSLRTELLRPLKVFQGQEIFPFFLVGPSKKKGGISVLGIEDGGLTQFLNGLLQVPF